MLGRFWTGVLAVLYATAAQFPELSAEPREVALPDLEQIKFALKDVSRRHLGKPVASDRAPSQTEVLRDTRLPSWPVEVPVFIQADLHGDLEVTLSLFYLWGLIDDSADWTGGPAWLVQLGDIVDRGPDSPLIYELFWRLRDQARKATGKILQLYGNHEVMNLFGQHHYISAAERHNYFGNIPERIRAEWDALRGYLGWNVLRTSLISQQTGDIIFAHAALMEDVADQIPDQLQRDFMKVIVAQRNQDYVTLRKLGKLVDGATSPIWSRDFAGGSTVACRNLEQALAKRNATLQIVGHTPTRSGQLEFRCNQRYMMADTGSSRWMGGRQTSVRVRVDPLEFDEMTDLYVGQRRWEMLQILRLPDFQSDHNLSVNARIVPVMTDAVCYQDHGAKIQVHCETGEPLLPPVVTTLAPREGDVEGDGEPAVPLGFFAGDTKEEL